MESFAQKSIRHCINMIAPLEISDEKIKLGQSQFYNFMISLYKEMYDKPEEFMVFSKPYDDYILT